LGDYNFPELDWSDNIDVSHPFVDCMNRNFLEQYCTEPTRGKNYLDLVFCTEDIIQDMLANELFETSDHQMISFKIKCSWVPSKTVKYDYFNADFNAVRMYANNSKLFLSTKIDDSDSSVENKWKSIKLGLSEVRSKFVKLKSRNKERTKWATKNVRSKRKAKKDAWNKYKNSRVDDQPQGDPVLYKIYQGKLRESVAENRRAKVKFEEKLASNIKNDAKSFFAYANDNKKNNSKIGPLKDDNKNIIESDTCAADYLNNYFVSVFVDEDVSNMPVPNRIFNGSKEAFLKDIEVDETIVANKINALNVNKSQGPVSRPSCSLYSAMARRPRPSRRSRMLKQRARLRRRRSPSRSTTAGS
jgi:hypothetical protein